MQIPVAVVFLAVCAGCAPAGRVSPGPVRSVPIYGAHIMQGEYTTTIEDPSCPAGGIRLKVDPSLDKTEFGKVLWHGGGKFGPTQKYVVIDGAVRVQGTLGQGGDITLVRVDRMSEVLIDVTRLIATASATAGCERDPGHRTAWLESLQRKKR